MKHLPILWESDLRRPSSRNATRDAHHPRSGGVDGVRLRRRRSSAPRAPTLRGQENARQPQDALDARAAS
jgi:hypothetical protein